MQISRQCALTRCAAIAMIAGWTIVLTDVDVRAMGPLPGDIVVLPHLPLRLARIDGGQIVVPQWGDKATALVFLSRDCPIANKYLPRLNALSRTMTPQRVRLVGVLADPTATRAAAQRHAADFGLEFPVIFDPRLEVARVLEPTHTPEAFVISAAGRLLYRGRIDDWFADVGKPRAQTTTHDLQDVLTAVAKDQPIEPRSTQPVGCKFEALTRGLAENGPTFTRDVAPILFHNCTECHRPGEVAPFALLSYEDAARRAEQIAEASQSGLMPPWKAAPEVGHFKGERRLSAGQRETLAAWAAAGAPHGEIADLPEPPKFAEGWRLGEPDLVVEMPEPFAIPAEVAEHGGNVYRWFPLELNLPENKLLSAYEFRSGNARVVHHAIMFLDTSRAVMMLDRRDPGPGYDNFGGPGFLPTGFVGSWSPGVTPLELPKGVGIHLHRRAIIALQMHYYATGKPESDRSRVGLHFVETPGARHVTSVPVMNADFEIPADAPNHLVTADITVPVDVQVIGLVPHMHYLGREMRLVANLPTGGEPVPLIWIKDWDFNWQDHYQLSEPISLPKGTQLIVEAWYDNTSGNPQNPHSPPRTVNYGSGSGDEMCLMGVQVAVEKPQHVVTIAGELVKKYLRTRDGKLLIPALE